jgi:hypothetical protein
MRCPVPGRPGVVHHQGLLGCQRDQGELGRGKACWVKDPRADVGDLMIVPPIVSAIFGEHHVIEHGPQLRVIDPQPHLCVR